MEAVEEVVIVGGGIAGLATALGLHRKGVRSLVLESSDELRAAGFAFTTWTNAWRALDALAIGDTLRQHHPRIEGLVVNSTSSGTTTSKMSLDEQATSGEHEIRCVRRDLLLETLQKELPQGSVRYSSKLVAIEDADNLKLLHLADGSTLKTKVLIGADGVNSMVAKWLGLKKPSFSGRAASRGFAVFPNGHTFQPEFLEIFGEGFKGGLMPCDERSMYWFFTWTTTPQDMEIDRSATMMKQFIVSKLQEAKVAEEVIEVIEKSDMTGVVSTPLRFRWPFELLWGSISKGNVCVAGDALHPMTPDLGQGACSALEDSVVLARCLIEALRGKHEDGEMGEKERIKFALEKFARQRRWRSFELIMTAYILGFIQEGNGAFMRFLKDKCLSGIMARMLLKRAEFDCGKL